MVPTIQGYLQGCLHGRRTAPHGTRQIYYTRGDPIRTQGVQEQAIREPGERAGVATGAHSAQGRIHSC